jgi:MFS family permease
MCTRIPEPSTPTKFSELNVRWLMLALLCASLIGNYYAFDGPTATMTQLSDHFYPGGNSTSTDDDGASSSTDPSTFQFRYNLLYSVYSWPNVILPFFGGYLCDKLGTRLMLVIFLLFITGGQAVFAMGASLDGSTAWYTMWLGRTIFGFGGESLCVAQSALIAGWFAGKELAFALGLNLALGRIGSVINDAVSVQIATNFPVYYAFWAAFGVCVASLFAGVWAFYVDKSADIRLRANRGERPRKETPLLLALFCAPVWTKICSQSNNNDDETELDSLVETALQGDEEMYNNNSGTGEKYVADAPTEVIEMSAVLRFPLTFWLLSLSCVCTYACVLCFNNFASGFIMQKWLASQPLSDLSPDEKSGLSIKANSIVSLEI